MTQTFLRDAAAAMAAAALFGGLALAAGEKKADAPSGGAPPAGVIATVDGVNITDQEVMSSIPQDRQRAFQNADARLKDIEAGAVQEILAKRYIDEQARAKGITPEAYLEQEIAANRDTFPAEYKTQIAQIKSQIYDAKRAALDDLIGAKLEDAAAKKRGVPVEQLVKTEVEDKVPAITPADIDQFYAQNQRMFGNQPKDAVSKQIEETLRNQKLAAVRSEFRASLRKDSQVRVYLQVPRIAVPIDGDPIKGTKDAPVIIVHFSDYQCPFCSRVGPTLDKVRKDYGDKVAVVFKDFPLSFHQNAQKAAEAANCADQQGKFWDYHDKLFANQSKLAVADLKAVAEGMGLDMGKFNQCLDSGAMKDAVDKDTQDGAAAGVQGTPASFINGRFVSGAQPFEGFKKVIDDELSSKGIAIPAAESAPAAAPAKS